jgi:glutathione S-transferase
VDITLYSADSCPYCVRTRLVLNGKRIRYELVQIDTADKPAWLRELNPRNRVPVLDVDGTVMWESEALNEYLDETFRDPPMMPGTASGRAAVRALMRRFDDFSGAYYAARRGEPDGSGRLHAELRWLEQQLADRAFLAGDDHSLADPGWWPWIARLDRVDVDLSRHPAVLAWSERLSARPEYAAELSLLRG